MPSWEVLYTIASGQDGYFTAQQAHELGVSPQSLHHYAKTERIERVLRGLYRLVHYPAGDHEELMVAWLWSDRKGVASHDTALALYDLSDVLPPRIHLTLPAAERARRRHVPSNFVLYYADVPEGDRKWAANVPVTTPTRTLLDCAADGFAPDLLQQAYDQALRRGLAEPLVEVERVLRPYFPKRARR